MGKESWNKLLRTPVESSRASRFEGTVLPHLDAAYNLARWLTRNDHDAQDVVQEAFLRALRAFDTFDGSRDARPWLLKIVRNTCYTWLRENRPHEMVSASDDVPQVVAGGPGPEDSLIRKYDAQVVRQALEGLPLEYREVLILREFDDFSYKEIADLIGIPLGTVMSRLSRGRKDLSRLLLARKQGTKA